MPMISEVNIETAIPGDPLPWMRTWPAQFLGSPEVALLNNEQFGMLFRLLCRAWQMRRPCFLPNNEDALWRLSGASGRSAFRKAWVLLSELFNMTLDGKFLYFSPQLLEYQQLVASRNQKVQAGKLGAQHKWNQQQGSNTANDTANDAAIGSPVADDKQIDGKTEVRSKKRQKQNPSRGTREADPRHELFKNSMRSYWTSRNQDEMPWDGSEGKALSLLLSANPSLTNERFQDCLRHRYRSEVNHAERPRGWLATITNFAQGPLNRYGKPLNAGATENASSSNRHQSKTDRTLAALAEVARENGMDFSTVIGPRGSAPSVDQCRDDETLFRAAG
jgi:hypothetical protein